LKNLSIKYYSIKDVQSTVDVVHYIYVITTDGELKMVPKDKCGIFTTADSVTGNPSKIHHHYLADSKPVISAGQFVTVDGKVKFIHNGSGHYKPFDSLKKPYLKKLTERIFAAEGFPDVKGKYQFENFGLDRFQPVVTNASINRRWVFLVGSLQATATLFSNTQNINQSSQQSEAKPAFPVADSSGASIKSIVHSN
jgi:hypothetical protein